MQYKEVEIIFDPSGNVSVDQIGWQGQKCEYAVSDLISAIGRESSVAPKREHALKEQVRIRE